MSSPIARNLFRISKRRWRGGRRSLGGSLAAVGRFPVWTSAHSVLGAQGGRRMKREVEGIADTKLPF